MSTVWGEQQGLSFPMPDLGDLHFHLWHKEGAFLYDPYKHPLHSQYLDPLHLSLSLWYSYISAVNAEFVARSNMYTHNGHLPVTAETEQKQTTAMWPEGATRHYTLQLYSHLLTCYSLYGVQEKADSVLSQTDVWDHKSLIYLLGEESLN